MDFTGAQLKLAEIYKIQLTSGEYIYCTNHSTNLVYSGNTYLALPLTRSSIEYYSNLQVDKVDISVRLQGVIIGGVGYSVSQVVDRGWLHGAHIWIYLVDWSLLNESSLLFEGFATGKITYNSGTCTLDVTSTLDKLNDQFPKLIYSELCQHTLYKQGIFACNVTKASFKTAGTVVSSADKFTITSTSFDVSGSFPLGYWLDGTIIITSGDNNGVSRDIKLHISGTITTRISFPDIINAGTTFDVYPGCDRTSLICISKFNNMPNFFGFEYIPKPEILYGI